MIDINKANIAIANINQNLGIKEELFTCEYDSLIEDPMSALEVNKEEVEKYMRDLDE